MFAGLLKMRQSRARCAKTGKLQKRKKKTVSGSAVPAQRTAASVQCAPPNSGKVSGSVCGAGSEREPAAAAVAAPRRI